MPRGTDLSFCVAPDATWTSNFGSTGGNLPATLPPGEVASYSTNVNGRLVADGSLNANFNSVLTFDARLDQNPITLELEDSRVTSHACDHEPIETMLRDFFAYENADRVGEIGFGDQCRHGSVHSEPLLGQRALAWISLGPRRAQPTLQPSHLGLPAPPRLDPGRSGDSRGRHGDLRKRKLGEECAARRA